MKELWLENPELGMFTLTVQKQVFADYALLCLPRGLRGWFTPVKKRLTLLLHKHLFEAMAEKEVVEM